MTFSVTPTSLQLTKITYDCGPTPADVVLRRRILQKMFFKNAGSAPARRLLVTLTDRQAIWKLARLTKMCATQSALSRATAIAITAVKRPLNNCIFFGNVNSFPIVPYATDDPRRRGRSLHLQPAKADCITEAARFGTNQTSTLVWIKRRAAQWDPRSCPSAVKLY